MRLPGAPRGVLLVLAVLALLSGVLFAYWQRQSGAEADAGADAAATARLLAWPDGGAELSASAAGDLVGSLAQRPAGLPADVDQQVLDVNAWRQRGKDALLNTDLLRIFEQLLGRGMDDPAALLASRIPAEYRSQAQRLLDQYQRYRGELAQLSAPRGATSFSKAEDYAAAATTLESLLAARRALQEKYFSAAEVDGLFGDDNRYDAFTVARLRLAARDDLSLADKEQQLAGLSDQLLTPEQREARQSAILPSRIAAQNAQMAAASSDERLAQRSNEFGAAAAQRMAEVDRQRAEWQQRIARYANADPATQQQLRATEFTAQERLRLAGAVSLYQRQQAQQSANAQNPPPSLP